MKTTMTFEIDPDDITPEMEQRWISDMTRDYPFLSPPMAAAIVWQYKTDPSHFTSEEFKHRMAECAGRAQELRGLASKGALEAHLTGESSEKYWDGREEKHIAECVPIEDKQTEKPARKQEDAC